MVTVKIFYVASVDAIVKKNKHLLACDRVSYKKLR
jgi:hypothetical protein